MNWSFLALMLGICIVIGGGLGVAGAMLQLPSWAIGSTAGFLCAALFYTQRDRFRK